VDKWPKSVDKKPVLWKETLLYHGFIDVLIHKLTENNTGRIAGLVDNYVDNLWFFVDNYGTCVDLLLCRLAHG
jgi:hypothetical protein